LVKLINDLLDISRIESGKVEMALGNCRLSKIIENVYDLMMPQLKSKNIQWKLDVDSALPEMFLDASQIERVFINLIGNAVKFTPERGAITIKAHKNDKLITVEVSDTGIGIPEEDQARLFDEFYRVDNEINQNVKGTGLGLSLAKKIVQAHDGKMWVTSAVGKGTTFHFTLPITTEDGPKTKDVQL
jgi:signal transduction histidine kinase